MGKVILCLAGEHSPLPSTVKPNLVNEALMEATVRNGRAGSTKVTVWMRTATFEQALCEMAVCLSPECTMGMGMVSVRGMFST